MVLPDADFPMIITMYLDYFPHDLVQWPLSRIIQTYESGGHTELGNAFGEVNWSPNRLCLEQVLALMDDLHKDLFSDDSERVAQLETAGNNLFGVLGGILGLLLVSMMLIRARLQRPAPHPRWIVWEGRINRGMYLTVALFVGWTALYFDMALLYYYPPYILTFNRLGEILLGLLIIGVFALNATYFVPRYLWRGQWRGYLLRWAGWLALILVGLALANEPLMRTRLSWLPTGLRMHTSLPYDTVYLLAWPAALWLVATLLVSTYLTINRRFVRQQIEQLQVHSHQLSANLHQLQAQMSPHFFFNALNSVYGFALQEDSPRTVEALETLSRLMRFALYQGNQRHIPLSQELAYLSDYVDLQRLRLDPTRHTLHFGIAGEASGQAIAPMLLINLIENAFKHGLSMQARSFVHIQIDITVDELVLTVDNSLHPTQATRDGGIGLANVQQRLDLLYPDHYTWSRRQTADRYHTELRMALI
jgi:hypothetical protein